MNNKTDSSLQDLTKEITPLLQKLTDAKMILSAKIEDGMKAKGWKHKDLLKAMNRDNPSLVTKWLSGTHNFTLETLIELEAALGIRLIDLGFAETEQNAQHKPVNKQNADASTTAAYKKRMSVKETSNKPKNHFRSPLRKKIKS